MVVRYRRPLLALATVALLAAFGFAVFAQPSPYPASLLAGLHWRDVGPMRGGRTLWRRRQRQPARHLLFRLRRRRRVEDRERRPHLESDLRRRHSDRLDRRHRGGSLESQHRLRRHRRARYPQPALLRHRHVQVDRRGQDLDAHRSRSHASDRTRSLVDPANPNRVYVAALGHVYDANPDRGVYPLARRRRNLEEDPVQDQRSRTMSAPSISPSIRRIRACSTLRCGLRAVRRGRSTRPATCPAADSTNPPTAATPGSN